MGLISNLTNVVRTVQKQAQQVEQKVEQQVAKQLEKKPAGWAPGPAQKLPVKAAAAAAKTADTFTPALARPREDTSVGGANHLQPKATLFVDGISPNDIKQGEVGDCTFQAAMSS